MTTIIAIQTDEGATFWADGLTVGEAWRPFRGEGMEKVWRRGEYLLAAAGQGPIVEAFIAWAPPPYVRDHRPAYRFMREDFVASLREHLARFDLALDNDTDETKFEGLVAVGGRVYQLDDAGGILVTEDGLYGIGNGAPYALGALAAGAEPQKAVEIAARFDLFTGPPFLTAQQRRVVSDA